MQHLDPVTEARCLTCPWTVATTAPLYPTSRLVQRAGDTHMHDTGHPVIVETKA